MVLRQDISIRGFKWTQWWEQDVAKACVVKWNIMIICELYSRGVERVESSIYLSRLVRNMFPWLQRSWGGGEPDAEQTKRISSPREKTWLWGWITTDGASAIGVKQRQNADDDSVNVSWRGLRCHYQHWGSGFVLHLHPGWFKKKKLINYYKHLSTVDEAFQ